MCLFAISEQACLTVQENVCAICRAAEETGHAFVTVILLAKSELWKKKNTSRKFFILFEKSDQLSNSNLKMDWCHS